MTMTCVSKVVTDMVDGMKGCSKPKREKIIQNKINLIVDECVSYLKKWHSEQQNNPWQMTPRSCFVATKKEMEMFRSNLAERYHIFTAAHEADYEEDVQVANNSGYAGGYATTTKKEMIRHAHDINQECNLTKNLDLNGQGSLCWQIVFNWFPQKEGPSFITGYGSYPLGIVSTDVYSYIEQCGKRDSFFNCFGHEWRKIVQTRIDMVVATLMNWVTKEPDVHGVRTFGKFVLSSCMKATEKEMSLLTRIFELCQNRLLVEFKEKEHHHMHEKEIHLTKELGGLIDPREGYCYELSFSWEEEAGGESFPPMLTYTEIT